jgi:hypothetical protein
VPARDLVFGIVAFDPRVGCGTACSAHRDGVRRWANSVRRHTSAASTELALFTGHGKGNIAATPAMERALRDADVRIIEGDFRDARDRVAHGERANYMWCVVRNRWSVIRDYLRSHAHRFRHVLMCDVRDAIVQSDPFAWAPRGRAAARAFDLRRTIVFSGEGSGSVKVLSQSKKGAPRTLSCMGNTPLSEKERKQRLLSTDPLNAGVTIGGAHAFANCSAALATLLAEVTTPACLAVKDCTDQGVYNVLAYARWESLLPHTSQLLVPMEGGVLSYTLGHKKGAPRVDSDGHVRDDDGHVPPLVHQFAKGAAGRALKRNTRFTQLLHELLRDGGSPTPARQPATEQRVQRERRTCDQCLMADGSDAEGQRLVTFCARHCSLTRRT